MFAFVRTSVPCYASVKNIFDSRTGLVVHERKHYSTMIVSAILRSVMRCGALVMLLPQHTAPKNGATHCTIQL